ncbi:hypothetical protein MKZ38_009883 [Zalerion maritima]|uniref:Uncharacterized protein n=1 Tax=Zalerion maritima TaxID=339359 RepID=A0AAD5WST8_9PEZI|nr:hypothetical protein MKZ38_009883 [Zalerion maritima]
MTPELDLTPCHRTHDALSGGAESRSSVMSGELLSGCHRTRLDFCLAERVTKHDIHAPKQGATIDSVLNIPFPRLVLHHQVNEIGENPFVQLFKHAAKWPESWPKWPLYHDWGDPELAYMSRALALRVHILGPREWSKFLRLGIFDILEQTSSAKFLRLGIFDILEQTSSAKFLKMGIFDILEQTSLAKFLKLRFFDILEQTSSAKFLKLRFFDCFGWPLFSWQRLHPI